MQCLLHRDYVLTLLLSSHSRATLGCAAALGRMGCLLPSAPCLHSRMSCPSPENVQYISAIARARRLDWWPQSSEPQLLKQARRTPSACRLMRARILQRGARVLSESLETSRPAAYSHTIWAGFTSAAATQARSLSAACREHTSQDASRCAGATGRALGAV